MYHIFTINPDGDLVHSISHADRNFIERCLATLEIMHIPALWWGW